MVYLNASLSSLWCGLVQWMRQQRADSQDNCNRCKGRSADAVGVLQISKPVLVVSLTENPRPQNVCGKLRFNLYVCSYKDCWLISAMLQQKCSDSTRRKPKACFALHLLSKVEKIFPTVPMSKSPCAGKGGAELKSKSSWGRPPQPCGWISWGWKLEISLISLEIGVWFLCFLRLLYIPMAYSDWSFK